RRQRPDQRRPRSLRQDSRVQVLRRAHRTLRAFACGSRSLALLRAPNVTDRMIIMAVAYIALGSNLGDRQQYLQSALAHLRQSGVAVERVSSMYETAPLGGPPGQGPYLNAAARVQTELAPRTLLDILLETERRLGRVRDV